MRRLRIVVDYTKLHRWAIRFVPLPDRAFPRHKRAAGRRWRVGETYIKGEWKFLNNLVEQDHPNIKNRIRLMTGFKSFRRAQTLLAGIELVHMIRKGQGEYPDGEGLSPA